VLQTADLNLAVATVRNDNPMLGKKLLTSSLEVAADFKGRNFDVLIDFTLPAGVMQHVSYCQNNSAAMVIGSTGFNDQQMQIIEQAALTIPILISANMSLGVNVCYKLLASAANMLNNEWQVSIHDVHHQHKKDSPSGTAKHMAQVIAKNSGRELDAVNICSERRGEFVGTHSVTFNNAFEEIAILHVAHDRSIFAQGAVTAARWLYKRAPGLYSMQDVV